MSTAAPNDQQAFEVQGLWWLPDNVERKVGGTLTWSIEDAGILSLIGTLRKDTWKDNVLPDGSTQRVRTSPRWPGEPELHPVVHGQVGRDCYTVLDGYTINRQGVFDSDVPMQRVGFSSLLKGRAWFLDLDDAAFDRMVVDLRHLTAWVGRGGLGIDYPHPSSDEDTPYATVTARTVEREVASHGDLTVTFFQTLEPTGDGLHEWRIKQRWKMEIGYPGLTTMEDLTHIASDVQDLVTMAVGSTADFDDVRFLHPDVPEMYLSGDEVKGSRAPISYYSRWGNRSTPLDKPRRPHEMYFTYDEFGGADGIGRWLATAEKYRTELGRVMGTRYSDGMYLEDRIMNVCAALDSFDMVRRSTGAWRKFEERLTKSMALAGQPFTALIGGDSAAWATRVRDLRDDIAHHKTAMRSTEANATYLVSQQVYWLFAMCMLREAGAPDEVFDHIAKNNTFVWLKQQAESQPVTVVEPDTAPPDRKS